VSVDPIDVSSLLELHAESVSPLSKAVDESVGWITSQTRDCEYRAHTPAYVREDQTSRLWRRREAVPVKCLKCRPFPLIPVIGSSRTLNGVAASMAVDESVGWITPGT
jgi:hypothetical protein